VTTVHRTLVDLAAVLEPDELALACHEAEVRYGTKPPQVEAVLGRRPNSSGRAKLRAVLVGDVPVTLSKLERRSWRFCERPAWRCRELTARSAGDAWIAGGRSSD
jgi:hypothetical protein